MIRKPRIRAPKRSAPVDIATLWRDKFGPAMEHILAQKSESLSFDDLYRSCYLLVSQQNGRSLYRTFNDSLKTYLVNTLLPQVSGDTIASFSHIWSRYTLSLTLLGEIFMYLNRGFCVDAKLPSVEQSGEILFRDHVLRPHTEALYAQLVAAINQARDRESIDTSSISAVTQMLQSLPSGDIDTSRNMYAEELLPVLVSATKTYYKTLLVNLLSASPTAITVLNSLKSWLDRENEPRLCLPSKSNEALCQVLEHELLPEALATAFAFPAGLSVWINDNDLKSLALAAELESRSGVDHSVLVETIGKVIRDKQAEYNAQALQVYQESGPKSLESVAIEWVNSSVALKKKINEIYNLIQHYFTNSKANVIEKLSEIWAESTNSCQVKTKKSVPEFLAIYTDQLLKKSSSFRSDTEIEQSMDDCLILFEAVSDKDAFSTSYGVKLGRRLLQNKSQSEELEHLFLSKLKNSAGQINTSHFQIMMTDIEGSQQLSSQFNQLDNDINVSTKINIGRTGIWDSSYTKNKVATLPPGLEEIRAKFESFYTDKHYKRKLTWNYKLGSADIKLNIGAQCYLVTLPLVCLSTLWLFKGDEELTVRDIMKGTNMPMEDLVPILQALSLVKPQRFLIKTPPGRQVEEIDVFKFNNDFVSPKKLIRVQLLSSYVRSENSKADTESMRRLEAGRNEQIQAAIVRVMKARKTLGHSALIQDVISVLSSRFNPQPQAIKRGINDLIDKDYMTRDPTDQNLYVYVA